MDMNRCTSSQASEAGRLLSGSSAGPTTGGSGAGRRLASHGLPPGGDKPSRTSDTSGPTTIDSCDTVDPRSSLGSRSPAPTPCHGSIEFVLTWTQSITPAGLKIARLAARDRASMLRRWLGSKSLPKRLRDLSNRLRTGSPLSTQLSRDLQMLHQLRIAIGLSRRLRTFGSGCGGWPTPQARDYRSGMPGRATNPDRSNDLNDFAALAISSWATPTALNWRSIKSHQHGKNARPLQEQAGLITESSGAKTGSSVVLNPAFPRWLIGYPAAWDRAAPGSSEWRSWQQRQTAREG